MQLKHVGRGLDQNLLSRGTSMVKFCASTTVAYIIVLIAEELGYAFTREATLTACSANQAVKARRAAAKAAARGVGA
jgi:hypothetical protein